MSSEIERSINVWSQPRYRDVMLPGLGALTCGELCAELTAARARIALLEEGLADLKSRIGPKSALARFIAALLGEQADG